MSRRILSICVTLSLTLLSAYLFRPSVASAAIRGLHVEGTSILDALGLPIILHGVNRSGGEFACVQGGGQWDGPMDAASIQAMLSWHINAVRVPLNEDCWLGINGANPGGASYQSAVVTYVNLLNSNGLYAILDLHWTNAGSTLATNQQPMPDADHAPAFWQSVATTFKNDGSVIFDLFNEPFPDNNQDTPAAWNCWKNGGTCPGMSYPAAGMQTLVTTVRGTGATNLIMLGGVEYSNSLTQWLANKPNDPVNNLAASWHSYNFNICGDSSCWDSQIAPVMQQVPVIAGEIGENDCAHGYIDSLMNWMDSHNASYLGWTWNTWSCGNGPALIANYNGTPTAYGQGYQAHLVALGNNPATVGIFSPTDSTFYLRYGNSAGAADLIFGYGPAPSSLTPLAGDWTGQGKITIGLYNPATGYFYLHNSNATSGNDIIFPFGPTNAGFIPIVGDWIGQGHTTVGVYNPATGYFYLKNSNSGGNADIQFQYGPGGAGLIPIVGDWTNKGYASVGLYSRANAYFYLKNSNSSGNADIQFQYGPATGNGGAPATPLTGRWSGSDSTSIGVYVAANAYFYLKNTNTAGNADIQFQYGPGPNAGWLPLMGYWR